MKVIVSAYAISPNHGSEPGMGWNWVSQIAKYCQVYVITESEFRDGIEKAVQSHEYRDNIKIIYIDIGDKARSICWNQGDWRFYYFYRKWQKQAYKEALKIVSSEKIDLIHQLNMIGYREPGFLWRISGIPFVWGPVGGFSYVRFAYLPALGVKQAVFHTLKNSLNFLQASLSGRVKSAARNARVILAASHDSRRAVSFFFKRDSIVLNETGCEMQKKSRNKTANQKTLKVIWVGRFIATKMLDLALDVIGDVVPRVPNLEFHIVGGGVDNESLRRAKIKAASIGLQDVCVWHGKVAHEEVQALMKEADLLFFPSIVEGTSHVVLEAISNGLPVLCFDICGHGEVVTEEIGVKIPLTYPADSIKRFSNAIEHIANNRQELLRMSMNCEARIQEISWEGKGRALFEVYSEICK